MRSFFSTLRQNLWVLALASLVPALAGCPGFLPPSVRSVSPDIVPSTLGATLTLHGKGFIEGAMVSFTRADNVTSLGTVEADVSSRWRMTVQAPATNDIEATEVVTCVVTNPNGKSSEPFTITYMPPPSVLTVAPTSVPATISTAVTLTGSAFEVGAQVRFMRADSTVIGTVQGTFVDANTITCSTPVDATVTTDSPVRVEVINTDGQVSVPVVKAVGSVTYLAPPAITDATPDPMRATTAESVTITGTNFDAASTVSFNLPLTGATAATNVVVNPEGTQITCTSPLEAELLADSTVTITVASPAPDGQTDTVDVTYAAAPKVSSIAPNQVPTSTAYDITVNGSGFKTGATVAVDGQAATDVVVVDANSLTCKTPARVDILVPTAVQVVVTNTDGQQSQEITKSPTSHIVTYYPAPVVNSADLAVVPATISTEVTLTGQYFRGTPLADAVGTSTVIFRNAGDSSVIGTVDATVVNDTTLTCMSPVQAGLTADLNVTMEVVDPQNQTQSTLPLALTYNAPPVLNAAAFATSPVASTLSQDFSITGGDNFNTAADGLDVVFFREDSNPAVEFGRINVTAVSATQADGAAAGSTGTPTITSPVLASDITVKVYVQNKDDNQVSESGLTVTYSAPPSITSVVHNTLGGAEVPATIAATVKITGTNFVTGATTQFDLPVGGSTAGANTAFASSTELTSDSAPLASGDISEDALVDVTVTNPDGQVSNAVQVNYQAQPGISSIATGITVGDVTGDVLPATLEKPFTAVITNGLLDETNAAALPSSVPVVNFDIATPAENVDATGVTVTSETGLSGTWPGSFTNTDDQVATVTITDAYGQVGAATLPITITAPPTLTELQATFDNGYTDRNVFPATLAVPCSLIGTNLRSDAVAEFFTDATLATSLGPQTTTVASATEVTGTTPVVTPTPDAHLPNVTVKLTNTDGQMTAAPLSGIKAVAPPVVTGASVLNGGDLPFLVANGALRNDFTGANGPAVTLRLTGQNLDSRSPNPLDATHPGALFVEFNGGARAIDGLLGSGLYSEGGGEDSARIVSDTEVQLEFMDSVAVDAFGVSLLASVFGYIDITGITDYTGQAATEGLDNAVLTVRGPVTNVADEGHAVAMAVGALEGPADTNEDLVVLTSGVSGSRVDLYPGSSNKNLAIEPAQSAYLDLTTGLTTPGSRNMLITDLNGDGFGDVAVGISDNDFLNDTDVRTAGAVYLWISAGAPVDLIADPLTLYGENAISYAPATGSEGFGAALASGDYNGDGLADLAIAAPGQLGQDGTAGSTGVVHLYLGNVNGITSAMADLTFQVAAGAGAVGRPDHFGLGLAFGDLNGDGYDDMVAGAPGFDGLAGADCGRVWVFQGASNVNNTADLTITGVSAGINTAYPVIANVNDDGMDDLFVGSPSLDGNSGELRLYLGNAAAVSGAFTVTPPSGGDPAGDGSIYSELTLRDTFGTTAATAFLDAEHGLVAGGGSITDPLSPAEGFVNRYLREVNKAFSFDFANAESYEKPLAIGLAATGDRFGSYVEAGYVLNDGLTGVDVFVSAPNADAGSNNGFLVMFPSPADEEAPVK